MTDYRLSPALICKHPGLAPSSKRWALAEQESLGPFPLLSALSDPALERSALDAVYAVGRDDLKNRRQGWHRQLRVRVVFGVCHIEMGRVKGAGRLHIEAVAAAFFIRDRDGT